MSTEGSRFVLTPVAGRRRGRLAVAAWLAALIAVVTWVLAAGVGSLPPGRSPVAAPGMGSSAPASLRPSPSGPMELFAGPPPSGTVWLRSLGGARSLDLATGKAGRPIGTGDWRDRILHLPDGRFVCVCSDVTEVDGSELVSISLADIDGSTLSARTELVTVEGHAEESGSADYRPAPVAVSASLSPDGSLIAIGIAVRRPPQWERSLLVVNAASRKAVQFVDLDPLPADSRVEAWAPRVQFAHDGHRALISLAAFRAGSPMDERHFVARIHGQLLALEPVPGFGTRHERADGQCVGSWLIHVDRDRVFGLCARDGGTPTIFRSVALDGGRITDLALGPVLNGVYPMQLVDRSRGILYLWDPFSHRAARIHVASAKLDSATTIDTPTAALTPIDRLARTFSAWIAPAALAKIMLEPGLALSPDGRTLYVVAMSGDGFAEPGRASMIHVLDAGSLALRATWNLEPDIVSIAIAPDNVDVLLGVLGEAPEGVAPGASVVLVDAETGQPRARYGGPGSEWPMLVDPSALNQ